MKITVVGAGAVGASCAEYIAIKNFASEVVILDIKEGFAEGKAMDLMQTASLNNFDTKITGTTNDYLKTANITNFDRSQILIEKKRRCTCMFNGTLPSIYTIKFNILI